jgi:hypothetical protein
MAKQVLQPDKESRRNLGGMRRDFLSTHYSFTTLSFSLFDYWRTATSVVLSTNFRVSLFPLML